MAKSKKYIWLVVIIFLVAGGFFYLRSKKPKTTYTTQDVRRGTLNRTVSVTGKLFAPENISLSFKSSGRIKNILVDVGSVVQAGDKIANLEIASQIKEIQAAEKDVLYQQKILADMRRNKQTFGDRKRDSQVALIRKAQDLLMSQRIKLAETEIYAPVSGVVIARSKDASEGVNFGEEVVVIAKAGDLEIRSNVPESDILDVKTGHKAEIKFDALPSSEMSGAEVVEIDPASTVIQDVVYYRIKLKLDRQDERLKVGMSEDVDILTASKDNVLMLPLRAVKTEGTDKFVEVLRDEKLGVTERMKVRIGMEGDDGLAEIVGGNLREGDKVITLVSNGK